MFSIGGYSTWYGANGSYVDLVGNVSALRNKYNSTDGEKGSQNGFGAGISLEAGYPWQIGSSNWQIEPQAQLAYQYTRLNSFNDGVRDFSEFNYSLQGTVERMDVAIRDLVTALRALNRGAGELVQIVE